MRDKIEILLFLIFILIFGLGYLIFPQREISEMENRYLSLCPEFHWKEFLNGEFSEDFESYTADQILGKDGFMKANVAVNRGLGVSRINQVYIGRDGYLIQDYQEPDEVLEQNISYIQSFARKNPEVDMTMLIIPNVNEIYPEKLPAFAATYPQTEIMGQLQRELGEDIRVVDGTASMLEHKEEYIYYKTDHHWTSLGAYYAYDTLCHSLGMEPTPLETYERLELTEPFYGSLYSKAPIEGQESDHVELFLNPSGEYTISNPIKGTTSDSMFVMEHALKKDKYAVFFGGNEPLYIIESNSDNGEKVLIIKDSYANCLVPMLADQFGEIHMMDLRYYHEDVSAYLQEHDIQKVIFIHNVDFISTDNNFLWL
ncbi:MAG: hypothetical protein K2N24_02510 [Lachnospiraceae bacterium]|nr:hypothetical protein [Lachnospiraceae bacterium]